MVDSRLVRMLSALDRSQLRSFKDFVRSPYWNKNENIIKLCDFIAAQHPKFRPQKLTEETAYEAVFGNAPFKENAINKILSKAYKLFETFIKVERTDLEGVQQKLLYLNFLSENGDQQDYTLYLKNLEKHLDKSTLRDVNYFYRLFLLEQEKSIDVGENLSGEQKAESALAAEKALDQFYLILKFNYADNLHSYQFLYPNVQFDSELTKELIKYFSTSPYFDTPILNVWWKALQLTQSSDKAEKYQALKSYFFDHYQQFNYFDLYNITNNLINHCRLVYADKRKIYQESFDLYKFLLETVFSDYPKLFLPVTFFNLIVLGIWLDELDWVENFLEDNKDYALQREDDLYILGKAMLAFARKDFELAHDYLLRSKVKMIYFRLFERRLWLKLYLEKEMDEQIEHAVRSFRKSLTVSKKGLTHRHLDANRNFASMLLRIHYLTKFDQDKVKQTIQQIEDIAAAELPEKEWLLHKAKVFLK